MVEKSKILMIDDHPLILEGYKSKLRESYNECNLDLIIDTACNCDEGYEKVQKSQQEGLYKIILLDINLPPSQNKKILSGEDLGQKIREKSSLTSLIVLTMYSENFRVMNILKNINPEAFLIKSDITPQEFLSAFNKVRNEEVYYSQTIIQTMRQQIATDIVLTENDRSILYYLANGVRTKDLVTRIPMSLAAIEKRKKMMKEVFDVEKGGDLALINKAKKFGFL